MMKAARTMRNSGVSFENGIAKTVLDGASDLGIDIPVSVGSAFEEFYRFLELHNRRTNLTAIKGAESVARFHFLDSLALLKVADFKDASVIDIGAGAGFPSVPLVLVEPSIRLTILDAQNKKVSFLRALSALLMLNAECIHARAEEAAFRPDLRESYDVALSRAVARLNVLCELCLPFVSVGGLFIAMKGVDSELEIEEAHNAINTLGAELLETVDYSIPGTDVNHRLISIRKTSTTLREYPRRFAKIKKEPL